MAFSPVSPSQSPAAIISGLYPSLFLFASLIFPQSTCRVQLCADESTAHCTRYALPLTVHYLPVGILFSGGRGLQLLLSLQGLCYDLWSRRSCDTLFGDESLGFCDMTWWTSAMELSRGSAVQSFCLRLDIEMRILKGQKGKGLVLDSVQKPGNPYCLSDAQPTLLGCLFKQ